MRISKTLFVVCRLSFLSHLSHLSKNNALIKIFVSDVFQKKKNEHFSKIFRPISDLFRPLLKHPETKGFATFRAKFSDLKMVGRNSRFFLQNALSFCIFAVRELAAYNRRLTVRKRQVVSSKPIAESPGSQHTSPSPLQEESQYKSKINKND
jgi:hypothetical protein